MLCKFVHEHLLELARLAHARFHDFAQKLEAFAALIGKLPEEVSRLLIGERSENVIVCGLEERWGAVVDRYRVLYGATP